MVREPGTNLLDIPPELVSLVGNFLSPTEMSSLRLACRYLSSLLLPVQFSRITLQLSRLPKAIHADRIRGKEDNMHMTDLKILQNMRGVVKHLVLKSEKTRLDEHLWVRLTWDSIRHVLLAFPSLKEVTLDAYIDPKNSVDVRTALKSLSQSLRGVIFHAAFEYSPTLRGANALKLLLDLLPAETYSLRHRLHSPGSIRNGALLFGAFSGLPKLEVLRIESVTLGDGLVASGISLPENIRILEFSTRGRFAVNEPVKPSPGLQEISIWSLPLLDDEPTECLSWSFLNSNTFKALSSIRTNLVDHELARYLQSNSGLKSITALEVCFENAVNIGIPDSYPDPLVREFLKIALPGLSKNLTALAVTILPPHEAMPIQLKARRAHNSQAVWSQAVRLAREWSLTNLPKGCVFPRLRQFSGCAVTSSASLAPVNTITDMMPALAKSRWKIFVDDTLWDKGLVEGLANRYIKFPRRDCRIAEMDVEMLGFTLQVEGGSPTFQFRDRYSYYNPCVRREYYIFRGGDALCIRSTEDRR